MDCADPIAETVVLRRIEDATTIAGTDQCSDVPGVSTGYSWDLVTTGNQNGLSSLGGLAADLLSQRPDQPVISPSGTPLSL